MKPGECRYADAHMAVATPEGGGRQDTSCCLLGGVSPPVSVLALGVRTQSAWKPFMCPTCELSPLCGCSDSAATFQRLHADVCFPLSRFLVAMGVPSLQCPRCPGSAHHPGLQPQLGAAGSGHGWDPLLTPVSTWVVGAW